MNGKINSIHFKGLSLLLLAMMILSSSNVQAETSELRMPQLIRDEANFSSGASNDIFFRPNYIDAYLSEYFITGGSTANYYIHAEDGTAGPTTMVEDSHFSQSSSDKIIQLSNTSSRDLTLYYEREYYNLLNYTSNELDGNSNGDENILLLEDKPHGFLFNSTAGKPVLMYLEFAQTEGARSLSLQIDIISPSGVGRTQYKGIPIHVGMYVPLYTSENGTYIVFLNSYTGDAMLSQIAIVDEIEVENINTGFSEQLDGVEAVSKFFEFDLDTTNPMVFELGVNRFVSQYVNSYNYLGTLEVRVFTLNQNIFGQFLPRQVVTKEKVLININIIPPDDEDANVKAIKEDLGLDKGFDVDYTIYATTYNLDDLPLNEDFKPLKQTYTGSKQFYRYTSDQDMIFSFNSTTTVGAIFTSMITGEIMYLYDYMHDILNNRDHVLIIIPAGDYIVSMQQFHLHRFQTFGFTTLSQNGSTSLTSTLSTPQFLYLPTSGFVKDYYNITYTSKQNASVSYDFNLYSSDGNNIFNHDKDFVHLANVIDPEFFVENSTLLAYAGTAPDVPYNVNGMFMRIEIIRNEFYNSSITFPDGDILATNDPSVTSKIRIVRSDNIANARIENPTFAYYTGTLTDGHTQDLLANNNSIYAYYNFEAEEGAYIVILETTNRTISNIQAYMDSTFIYGGLESFRMEMIDNITHYFYIYEFAVTESKTLGFEIDFNGPISTLNGTLVIHIDELEIAELPLLSLEFIETEVERRFDPGSSFGTFGISATVVAVVGVSAGTYIIFRRRSSVV
jgi:hypothetical protein